MVLIGKRYLLEFMIICLLGYTYKSDTYLHYNGSTILDTFDDLSKEIQECSNNLNCEWMFILRRINWDKFRMFKNNIDTQRIVYWLIQLIRKFYGYDSFCFYSLFFLGFFLCYPSEGLLKFFAAQAHYVMATIISDVSSNYQLIRDIFT